MGLFNKKQPNTPRRRSIDGSNNISTRSRAFKRNRTLTGTTSNHLETTDTKNGVKSPRVHAHNLSIRRRKIAIFLLFVIFSAIPIWILISNFTASVTVSYKDVEMTRKIDESKYVDVIQDYLGINPMSRLSFILDQSAITAYVSAKLPEVANVKQGNMVGIGKANFLISMRKPVAGWQINNKQFYVDAKGIPFEKNYFPQPSVRIIDNSGISTKISTVAIASNRFLSFVGRVVSLSKSRGYNVTQASLPANTTRELTVRIKEGNHLVKLSIDRPAGEQVEDMVSAIKYFTRHGQSPRYIDVRVSGKAFYK